MNYRIDGDNLPVLKVRLSAGEQIECEAGAMSWMDDEIEMQTKAGGLGRILFNNMYGYIRKKYHTYTQNLNNQRHLWVCGGQFLFLYPVLQ